MSYLDRYGDIDALEENTLGPYSPEFLSDYAKQSAVDVGVDPEIFASMGMAESGFNPYAISEDGARGPLQFMPGTASDFGIDASNSLDNIKAGSQYLKQNLDKFGNYPDAVAAHNAGPGAVAKYGGVPPYEETQGFVSKVLGKLPPSPKFDSNYGDSPLGLPNPSRRLADLSAAQEEVKGLEALKSEALGQIGKGSNLTGQEALVTALTAIVPMLIGMGVHGKQGAAMGAQAGAAGAGVGLSGFAAEAKEREAASKLQYADASTALAAKRGELKGVKDSIADREERNVELKYVQGQQNARSKEYNKTQSGINAPKLSDEARKSIMGRSQIAADGKQVINFLKTEVPELLTESYTNPDGSTNWDGTKEILLNRLNEVAGPESSSGRAKQQIEQFLSGYQKAMSGLAATDKEFARLYGQLFQKDVLQGQLLPTSWPTAVKLIETFVKKQEALAQNDMTTDRALSAGDARAIKSIFQSGMGGSQEVLSPTATPWQPPVGAKSGTLPSGEKAWMVGNKVFLSDGTEVKS